MLFTKFTAFRRGLFIIHILDIPAIFLLGIVTERSCGKRFASFYVFPTIKVLDVGDQFTLCLFFFFNVQ